MVNYKPEIVNPVTLPDLTVRIGIETLELYIPNTMFIDPENLKLDFKAYYQDIDVNDGELSD